MLYLDVMSLKGSPDIGGSAALYLVAGLLGLAAALFILVAAFVGVKRLHARLPKSTVTFDPKAHQEGPSIAMEPARGAVPVADPVWLTAQVRIDSLITLERLGYSKTEAIEMLPTPLGLAIQQSLRKG